MVLFPLLLILLTILTQPPSFHFFPPPLIQLHHSISRFSSLRILSFTSCISLIPHSVFTFNLFLPLFFGTSLHPTSFVTTIYIFSLHSPSYFFYLPSLLSLPHHFPYSWLLFVLSCTTPQPRTSPLSGVRVHISHSSLTPSLFSYSSYLHHPTPCYLPSPAVYLLEASPTYLVYLANVLLFPYLFIFFPGHFSYFSP